MIKNIAFIVFIGSVIFGLWSALTGRPAFGPDYWLMVVAIFISVQVLLSK